MRYIQQLDALRAGAVLLVVFSHWFPQSFFLNQIFPESNGAVGVDFFFVLSGFLITQILLVNKEKKSKASQILKGFYIRRSLRIFPVYYLLLFLLLLFHPYIPTPIHQDAGYFFSYTSNLIIYLKQAWPGTLSPLWSLAVEEQFYLLWPWVIVFTPNRFLLPVILSFIILGIASNFLLPEILPYKGFIRSLTPATFDAFGLGGLMAYFLVKKQDISKYIYAVAFAAAIPFVLTVYFKFNTYIPLRTLTSLLSLALLTYAIKPRENLLYRWVLTNQVLIQIGKFSYGIYLFHNFIPPLLKNWIGTWSFKFVLPTYFIVLFAVAWLSWRFLETPINNLKKHFTY